MAFEAFEFDVSLRDTDPPPWRRLQLPAPATFLDLHHAIQHACGWWDYHLWRFTDFEDAALAGVPELDDPFGDPDPDAAGVRLSSYFPEGRWCTYLYDFGDSWEHHVELTRTIESAEPFKRRLVDGRLAFPPEDSGGVWGYWDSLRILRDGPQDQDDEARLTWLGDWHPEEFDLETTKAAFDA